MANLDYSEDNIILFTKKDFDDEFLWGLSETAIPINATFKNFQKQVPPALAPWPLIQRWRRMKDGGWMEDVKKFFKYNHLIIFLGTRRVPVSESFYEKKGHFQKIQKKCLHP